MSDILSVAERLLVRELEKAQRGYTRDTGGQFSHTQGAAANAGRPHQTSGHAASSPGPRPGPPPGAQRPSRTTAAPLGAKVVHDFRRQLRAGGMTHEQVQHQVERMREHYRSTGKLRVSGKAHSAGIKAQNRDPQAWHGTVHQMRQEFHQRRTSNKRHTPRATGAVPVHYAKDAWHYAIAKSAGEKRFTLGPFYIPDRLDAHHEWASPDDLQQGVWDYVRKNKRDIHLQHSGRKAGEWVEIVSWPYATEVEMVLPDEAMTKGVVRKERFPEGTAYMGVVWEPWAWDLVKAGKLRGLSMGGFAQRVEVDFAPAVAKALKPDDPEQQDEDPFDAMFGPEGEPYVDPEDPPEPNPAEAEAPDVPPDQTPAENADTPPDAAPPVDAQGNPLPGDEPATAVDAVDARREAAANRRRSAMWSGVKAAWARYTEGMGLVAKSEEHPFIDLLDQRAKEVLTRDAAAWLATGPTPGRMLEVAEMAEEDLTPEQLRALLGLDGDEAFDLLILGAVELFGGGTVEQAIAQGPEEEETDEFAELGEDEGTAEDQGEVDEAPTDQAPPEETPAEPAPTDEVGSDVPPEAPVPPKKKRQPPWLKKYSEAQARDPDGRFASNAAGAMVHWPAGVTVGGMDASPEASRNPEGPDFGERGATGHGANSTAKFDTDGAGVAANEFGKAIESAGFHGTEAGTYANDFGETIEVKSVGSSVIVNERDPEGELTRSSKVSSMADWEESEVAHRLGIESAMWAELYRDEPMLVKMFHRLRDRLGGAPFRPAPPGALSKYSEDQPRDEAGKWTSGGGGMPSASPGGRPLGQPGPRSPEDATAYVNDILEERGGQDLVERYEHVHDMVEQYKETHSTEMLYEHGTGDLEEGTWRTERAAIQDGLIEEVLDAAEDIPNEGKLVVMGGIPGAGKGFVQGALSTEELGFNPDEYLVINPDDFKEDLEKAGAAPAVNSLTNGDLAAFLHEESSLMAKDLAIRAAAEGKNIVWDFTMSSPESVAERMTDMARVSPVEYSSHMVFVDTPVDSAVAQAAGRWADSGRYVDLYRLAQTGDPSPNLTTFQAIRAQGDSSVLISNPGPGSPVKVIDSR